MRVQKPEKIMKLEKIMKPEKEVKTARAQNQERKLPKETVRIMRKKPLKEKA